MSGLTRVAPDGRWCDHERPLVNAGRYADVQSSTSELQCINPDRAALKYHEHS
jgi:hypothetical protein